MEESRKQEIPAIAWMDTVINVLGKVGAVCAGLCLVIMTIIMSAATISRYVFMTSWRFTEELTGFLLLAVFVMALLYVLVLGRHIRVSIIFDRIPVKVRAYLWVMNSVIAAAYAGFIVGEGIRLVNQLIKYNVKYMTMPVPEAVGVVSIPIGAGLFGLGCLAILVKQVLALILKSYEVGDKW